MTAASVTGGSDSQEEVCSCGGVGPCAGSAAPAEALILLSQLRTLRVLLFFFFFAFCWAQPTGSVTAERHHAAHPPSAVHPAVRTPCPRRARSPRCRLPPLRRHLVRMRRSGRPPSVRDAARWRLAFLPSFFLLLLLPPAAVRRRHEFRRNGRRSFRLAAAAVPSRLTGPPSQPDRGPVSARGPRSLLAGPPLRASRPLLHRAGPGPLPPRLPGGGGLLSGNLAAPSAPPAPPGLRPPPWGSAGGPSLPPGLRRHTGRTRGRGAVARRGRPRGGARGRRAAAGGGGVLGGLSRPAVCGWEPRCCRSRAVDVGQNGHGVSVEGLKKKKVNAWWLFFFPPSCLWGALWHPRGGFSLVSPVRKYGFGSWLWNYWRSKR